MSFFSKDSTKLVKCQYGYKYNLTDLFTTAVTDVSTNSDAQ